MLILGLNAFHADSAAALVQDGNLVAAAEEERFRRIKHWAGFPSQAISYCLREAGVELKDIDHIAINQDSGAHLWRKALYAASHPPATTKPISTRAIAPVRLARLIRMPLDFEPALGLYP